MATAVLVLRPFLAWDLILYSAVVGDFNGDGKQDIATANNDFPNPGSVSILMRDCGL